MSNIPSIGIGIACLIFYAIYQQLADSIERGIAAVGEDTTAGKRLTETREFFLFIAKELPILIGRIDQGWKVRKETKALAIKWDDELVKATNLTRDGDVVHASFQPKAA